jgi:thiosulfate dehydrogenase (quinone) large subunit
MAAQTALSAFSRQMPAWVLAPLRLFLGVTFIYAGVQKLTDPQFFNPHATGYIDKQLIAFATGTPLHNLLIQVAVPHAVFFGGLVAYGELAIGLGVLAGLLLRPAAVFGALLSLLFFLSASWRVRPYFYGADIVFFFAWLPIVLAGAAACAWPTLDAAFAPRLLARLAPAHRARLAPVLAVVLGVTGESAAARIPPQTRVNARGPQHGRRIARGRSRRDFLWGAAAGIAGTVATVLISGLVRQGDQNEAHGGLETATATTTPAPVATVTPGGPATATSGATATPAANVIAQTANVPTNSSATFTLPSNGDPGVLVHLTGGQFVAFDATCTHAGCPVQYDPGSQLLLCPCHGAAFDPAHQAAVVQGPAPTSLASVSITVQNGVVTLTS